MITTTGAIYAIVTMALWFGWPLLLLTDARDQSQAITTVIVIEFFLIGSFILAHFRCSSPVLRFWSGLCIVGAAWRTGIVQISLFIACPIIFIAYLLAVFFGIFSFVLGKSWAERSFLRLCHILCRGKFDLKKAQAALSPASPTARVA